MRFPAYAVIPNRHKSTAFDARILSYVETGIFKELRMHRKTRQLRSCRVYYFSLLNVLFDERFKHLQRYKPKVICRRLALFENNHVGDRRNAVFNRRAFRAVAIYV